MSNGTSERTNRQKIIDGWNQDALDRLNISLIGDSTLTNYLLVYLSGLFQKTSGNIKLIGNARIDKGLKGDFLINGLIKKYTQGKSKVHCLADAIKIIHPSFRMRVYHTFYDPVFLDGTDIIIDLSNNPFVKHKSLGYSIEKDKVWIGAISDQTHGIVVVKDKDKKIKLPHFKEFEGKHQGIIPSGLIAGIVSEEIRKQAFRFNERDQTLEGLLCYNLNSKDRFSPKDTMPECFKSFSNKKVLVVGGGGIGNYASLGLALLGVGTIDIVDYDTVQESDLNRQFLFYDSEGQKKTDALARKLKCLNPFIKINPLFGKVNDKPTNKGLKVDKNYISKNKYDLILSCVDNGKARYILNDIALELGIPLVDGGVSYKSGTVRVIVPGKTACLNELSSLTYTDKKNSCMAQMPSVVYTNSITAFAMLGEVRNILFPKIYGEPIQNNILYSSLEQRSGLRMLLKTDPQLQNKDCKCYKRYNGELK